jgi:2'-5' RNA ligase
MRLFVAVDPTDAVRAALAAAQATLREASPNADVRWVDPKNLHLTIKFLGNVADERAGDVRAAVTSAVAGHARIALGARGLGAFPSLRKPRIVWAGLIGGVAPLRALAAAIDTALEPLGHPREDRPFAAHVTLGRVRSPKGVDRLTSAVTAGAALDFGGWKASDVVLYRSHTRPTGSVYEPVARIALDT